jgi:hypothetical protein
VTAGPAGPMVPVRLVEVGPEPVITRSESGQLNITWPDGKGTWVQASADLVEQAVEHVNALHRVATEQAAEASRLQRLVDQLQQQEQTDAAALAGTREALLVAAQQRDDAQRQLAEQCERADAATNRAAVAADDAARAEAAAGQLAATLERIADAVAEHGDCTCDFPELVAGVDRAEDERRHGGDPDQAPRTWEP